MCPPTTAQINAGLPGCGLTMIDLTSFTPVAAGSVLVEYAGDPLLPPNPTLVASTTKASPGATVSVGDAPVPTTYWWLVHALVPRGPPRGRIASDPGNHGHLQARQDPIVTAANNITVSPAVYNRPVLTPPKISGGFTVPAGLSGAQKVTVNYSVTIFGLTLANAGTVTSR